MHHFYLHDYSKQQQQSEEERRCHHAWEDDKKNSMQHGCEEMIILHEGFSSDKVRLTFIIIHLYSMIHIIKMDV